MRRKVCSKFRSRLQARVLFAVCTEDGGVEQCSLALAARRSENIEPVGGCGLCQLMAPSDPPDRIAPTQGDTRWRGPRAWRRGAAPRTAAGSSPTQQSMILHGIRAEETAEGAARTDCGTSRGKAQFQQPSIGCPSTPQNGQASWSVNEPI